MLILGIDTSHRFLSLVLIHDDHILDSIHYECFKKQSENIFVEIKSLFSRNNLNPNNVDAVVVAIGPGSYTGIRIGLTIAKVIASLKSIPLYTISTLCLYANNQEKALVVLDARSNRAYYGYYDKSATIFNDVVGSIKDINIEGYKVIGDGSLVGVNDFYFNTPEAFLNTKNSWQLVNDVDTLSPVYLKENTEYEV